MIYPHFVVENVPGSTAPRLRLTSLLLMGKSISLSVSQSVVSLSVQLDNNCSINNIQHSSRDGLVVSMIEWLCLKVDLKIENILVTVATNLFEYQLKISHNPNFFRVGQGLT